MKVCFDSYSTPNETATIRQAYATGRRKRISKTLGRMRHGYFIDNPVDGRMPITVQLRWTGRERVRRKEVAVGLGITPGVEWPFQTGNYFPYFLVWVGQFPDGKLFGRFMPMAWFDFDSNGHMRLHAAGLWSIRLLNVRTAKP